MQQNGDPSVEEILESIKKVIARDNKETALNERHRRENEGVILRGPGSSLAMPPLATSGNDDELDELDEDEGEVFDLGAEMVAEEAEFSPVAENEAADDGHVELIEPSATVEDIAEDAEQGFAPLPEPEFNQLANSPAPEQSVPAFDPPSSQPETPLAMTEPLADLDAPAESPLERMVRESLRPMLREWLDENLPPLVERVVKEELERIMGRPR